MKRIGIVKSIAVALMFVATLAFAQYPGPGYPPSSGGGTPTFPLLPASTADCDSPSYSWSDATAAGLCRTTFGGGQILLGTGSLGSVLGQVFISNDGSQLYTSDTGLGSGAISLDRLASGHYQAEIYSLNSGSGSLINVDLARGISFTTQGAKPTCDSTNRRRLWIVSGGVGVADTVEICTKDAADAYAWRNLL